MSVLLYSLMAFVFGFAGWFALPTLAHMGPSRIAEAVMRLRARTALRFFGRGLLIERGGGRPLLKRTSMGDKYPADMCRINGNLKGWTDPSNMMGLWHGKPFGIAHLDSAMVVNPVTAHLSQLLQRYKQDGDLEDGGKYKHFFGLDRAAQPIVTAADALPAIQGNVPPGAFDLIDEYIEKAHTEWNSPNVMDMMQILMAFGAGLGGIWLASQLAARSGGGGGTTIPLFVEVLPL